MAAATSAAHTATQTAATHGKPMALTGEDATVRSRAARAGSVPNGDALAEALGAALGVAEGGDEDATLGFGAGAAGPTWPRYAPKSCTPQVTPFALMKEIPMSVYAPRMFARWSGDFIHAANIACGLG